ncbi:UMP kinase [Methanonatronarchaeum sp. AMET6-2]|uniref:UMP kinase n=1 Tax=Methanonatronarchaeum sp. AMET6-2 TaxID=2933293 RepID=UPI00121A7980|nr:UMP kinase [Methanonatronarchaeum sp. AMET6-2]RZN63227.1 MAG: UMP kinase [Methanonatronarchaeia archaeon]UOY10513.1 UMP kinase [Methanonatronarchaeum sp. AMET6-2]
MSIVISLGGSILAPNLEGARFGEYSDILMEISGDEELVVVTGGGEMAREYIGIARGLGANEASCDSIGIEVTRLNARLLISALGSDVFPEPPESYEEALRAFSVSDVVVMGGVSPGQSTDAVSALVAEYIDAELLVFATSVDGVYTSDPRFNEDAEKLDRISPSRLVEIVMETEIKAGAKSVVDPLASKIIERSEIPTVVLDGSEPDKIRSVVLDGQHEGTLVVSDDHRGFLGD